MLLAFATMFVLMSNSGCDSESTTPVSASGVKKATVDVKTDANGNTIEQLNVAERYKRDNQFGAIKHLYIISAYSGQVIIYSTVKGKVTSSGKRLTPTTIIGDFGYGRTEAETNYVDIAGKTFVTNEVLQDDGTYGSSIEYLYWFDSKGIYHQQYITGGMILHISDQPLSGVKSVIINTEIQ
jgi:hypothetical protein